MIFTFKHPKTGEIKRVDIPDQTIRERFEDDAREKIDCGCNVMGGISVNDCNCHEFFDEFEMQ